MRKTSLLFLFALALPAQPNVGPKTLMSGSMTFTSNGAGLKITYSTVVESQAQSSKVNLPGGAAGGKNNVMHRYMVDQVHAQYFGYDLTATPGLSPGHFTVTVSPLTLDPGKFGMGDASTLRPVPLPTYPPPQDVEEGDTIALDLLVSADGKQKVVDYFQVRRINPDGLAAATTSTSARDYSIDDGAPHFTFDGTRVLINGKSDAGPASTTKPGSTLWIAAPNQGRYILSLLPHDGFQKSGTIRDNVISFQSDGQQYEIRTPDLIFGVKGAWNLYVMHDPQYQSKANWVSMGTDRLENLLPNR